MVRVWLDGTNQSMRNGVVAARRSYTTLVVPMHGPRLSAPVPACEPSVWPVHRAGALAWGAQGRTLFVGMIDCMSCELVSSHVCARRLRRARVGSSALTCCCGLRPSRSAAAPLLPLHDMALRGVWSVAQKQRD